MDSGKSLQRIVLQNNLLSSNAQHSVPAKDKPKLSRPYKILLTISLYTTFVTFGLCRGLFGPTLEELQCITGAHFSQISSLFTWAGVGGILGTLTFGVFFDKFPSVPLFIVAHVLLAGFTGAIPWCQSLPLMMTLVGGQAFCYMGLAVGCNVVILRLWRKHSSPTLLGMHVLFTVGCFLAPILAEPFLTTPDLTPLPYADDSNTSNIIIPSNINDSNIGKASALESNARPVNYHCDSQVFKPYFIVASLSMLIAVFNAFLFLFFRNQQVPTSKQHTVDLRKVKDSGCVRYLSWGLFCLMNSCLGGIENILMGLMFFFSNVHCGFSKSEASHLVAGTFAAFGIGRALAVFFTHCIHVRIVVTFYFCLTLAASGIVAYYVNAHALVLWICFVVMFAGLGPMFASGLLWARDYLSVTGRFTSSYVFSYTVGMMSWPYLVGNLLENSGARWFPYIITMLLCVCVLICSVLCFIHWRCKTENKDLDKMIESRLDQVQEESLMASMWSLQTI